MQRAGDGLDVRRRRTAAGDLVRMRRNAGGVLFAAAESPRGRAAAKSGWRLAVLGVAAAAVGGGRVVRMAPPAPPCVDSRGGRRLPTTKKVVFRLQRRCGPQGDRVSEGPVGRARAAEASARGTSAA